LGPSQLASLKGRISASLTGLPECTTGLPLPEWKVLLQKRIKRLKAKEEGHALPDSEPEEDLDEDDDDEPAPKAKAKHENVFGVSSGPWGWLGQTLETKEVVLDEKVRPVSPPPPFLPPPSPPSVLSNPSQLSNPFMPFQQQQKETKWRKRRTTRRCVLCDQR
jgi:hypothetical protein